MQEPMGIIQPCTALRDVDSQANSSRELFLISNHAVGINSCANITFPSNTTEQWTVRQCGRMADS